MRAECGERSDRHPRNLDLRVRRLQRVLARTPEQRDAGIEQSGEEVGGEVEWPLRHDGDDRSDTVTADCANWDVGVVAVQAGIR